jgi:DNA-binding CsgD family transcriptional regulator
MLTTARSLGIAEPQARARLASPQARPPASHPPGAIASPAEDGVFLVDAQTRVLFANSVGRSILARRNALRLGPQGLAAADAADTAALRRLVGDTQRERVGGALVITREGNPSLLLVVVPLTRTYEQPPGGGACAILFAKDLQRVAQLSLDAFRRYYGLTPTQTALLREIIKGDGVAATALRLGISYATARSNLLLVYQKTGARRQAELVSLALQWLGDPGPLHLHQMAEADLRQVAVG